MRSAIGCKGELNLPNTQIYVVNTPLLLRITDKLGQNSAICGEKTFKKNYK